MDPVLSSRGRTYPHQPRSRHFVHDEDGRCVNIFMDTFSRIVYNFCMMPFMVKEADLDRIEVPEDYEALDATALGRRLGFKRDTVLAYLS
jgi:hypothetical protein